MDTDSKLCLLKIFRLILTIRKGYTTLAGNRLSRSLEDLRRSIIRQQNAADPAQRLP